MDSETRKKVNNNVLLQGSILAAASIIVRIIGLIYRIPLTRIIGDEAMGYYSTAFEFYNLALLLSSYSLPLAVSRLVSARQIQQRYRDAGQVFIVGLIFGCIVGAIASILVYAGADIYAQFNDSPLVAIPLRVLAPTIFVFSVMGVVRGSFQGYNNMIPTAISQIIEQIVNAIVSIAAAVYMMKKYQGTVEQSAYGAAGGTWGTFSGACAAAVTLVVILAISNKRFAEDIKNDSGKERESSLFILKALIVTVIPVVVSQTVYQLSGTIDVSIFHRIMSSKNVAMETRNVWWGIYSGKYKLLTNVPVAIASAMGTAIVPSLVAEMARGTKESVKEKISSAIKFNMVIAFPCAFGFMALGGPILQMLYGDFSELSEMMMTIGGIAVVFFALSTVTNGVLQGIGHMQIPVLHSVIALVIHCITLWALLRFTSLDSIALVICNILFAVVVCVLNARSIHKLLDYQQEWNTTFIIPLISSCIMGAFAHFGYEFLHFILGKIIPTHVMVNVTVSCLVAILASIIVYFALLIRLRGVSEKELLGMPKGRVLVKVLKKIRLLRD